MTPEPPPEPHRRRLRLRHPDGPSWPVMIGRGLALTAALVGAVWLGGHPQHLPGGLRDIAQSGQPAVQSAGVDAEDPVAAALEHIESSYWRPVSHTRLRDGAVRGAVAELKDPYSRYISAAEQAEFARALGGRYAGIGVHVIAHPDGLKITRVTNRGPADQAGLRPGDVIVAVAGRTAAGPRRAAAAVNTLRGEPDTPVEVQVRRGRQRIERTLTRRELKERLTRLTMHETADGVKVARVWLGSFAEGAAAAVARDLRRGRDAGAQAAVLDLRGNGGGLVEEAADLVSLFVSDGLVVELRSRTGPSQRIAVSGRALEPTLPLVVAVDGASASAAEITAAALADHDRAVVVGQRTYGKGVFQELFALPGGGALDITVGGYYTPSGRSLGGGGVRRGDGVRPDVTAPDKPRTRTDETLRAALDALRR